MTIFVFLILSFVVFLVLSRLYFRSLTFLKISLGSDPKTVSVKPTRKWFDNVRAGRASSFVHLSGSYFAYIITPDPEVGIVKYNQISVSDEIYVFQRSRFGRFRSIDLSDRSLFDIIKKFSEV